MSTASTSALSSLLSSLNNGNSGLDVTSAVASVIYAERAPERAWQAQQTTLNSQASALQQLDSEASSLTGSLQSLSDISGAFSALSTASSNAGVVTATASSGAVSGSHTVLVNSLATTDSWYSNEVASSSTNLGNGSYNITVGGATTTFTTGRGVNTLDQLVGAINAANLGVNATVVNDANGARLSLVANNSGAAADFSVTSGPGRPGALTFTHSITGADASIHVDGVPVSSATNTVTGAIAGVTLNLQSAAATASTISISPDTSTIGSAVASFVSAYNAIINDLKTQFTYNAGTGSEGVLGSDSSARALQSDVLSAANVSIGSGTLSTLQSLGISTQQDGTLSLNAATLNSALSSNYKGVQSFFQGSGSTPGFASTLIGTLNRYTDSSQGAFSVDLKSISSEYQDLATQTNTFELYVATQQTVLTTEYNNANIALQQLPQKIKQTQVLLGQNTSGSNG